MSVINDQGDRIPVSSYISDPLPFLIAGLCLVVLLSIWYLYSPAFSAIASLQWDSVPATPSLDIHVEASESGHPRSSITGSYEYFYHEMKHRSDSLSYFDCGNFGYEARVEFIRSIDTNSRLSCYVNPNKPDESISMPFGFIWTDLLPPSILLALHIAFGLPLYLLVRQRRSSQIFWKSPLKRPQRNDPVFICRSGPLIPAWVAFAFYMLLCGVGVYVLALDGDLIPKLISKVMVGFVVLCLLASGVHRLIKGNGGRESLVLSNSGLELNNPQGVRKIDNTNIERISCFTKYNKLRDAMLTQTVVSVRGAEVLNIPWMKEHVARKLATKLAELGVAVEVVCDVDYKGLH